ncbi:MAG: glycosyltransferase family 4 protein [Promethearchaeia archaeon]
MRIARTIESFYPVMSGPANQAYRISAHLEKNGIHSPVLTSNIGVQSEPLRETLGNVKVRRFPIKAKFMKYYYTPEMKRFLHKKKFDIYHAHSYRSYQTELAFKIARKKEKPFVINNHGSLYAYKLIVNGLKKLPYLVYDLCNRKIIHEADVIVANSKQEFKMLRKEGIPSEKIETIPVPINAEKYKPFDKKWNELRLLFVGRICRDRNLDAILKTISDFRGDNIQLRIVGPIVKRSNTEKVGYVKELKLLIDKLGIHRYVKFLGPRYGKDLLDIYRSSDIFLYTSVWENFGQTILEAAAAGLPLICTPVGVALELIEHGKTGFIVNANKPDEIANSIRKVREMNKKKIQKALRKKVKKNYSMETVYRKYLDVYQKLL